MHPVLINLGPFPIHTYGFLIAIGFLVGLFVIKKLAPRAGLDVDWALDVTFWCTLVGFLGARLLYVLTRFEDFLASPISIFKVWEGGLVFWGGPLAAVPFLIWSLRKNKVSVWNALDVGFPGLIIAHAFGRLGCLSAGCCYGKPTGSSFGIRFYSDLVDRNLHGIPLHPTQLYEAFALFILFLGTLYIFKKRKFQGQVALSYLMAYPIIRCVIEVFRGDLIRGFIIDDWLSTSQFISILVFAGATAALIFRLRQVERKGSQ